jgi:hypothetical protein
VEAKVERPTPKVFASQHRTSNAELRCAGRALPAPNELGDCSCALFALR